MSKVGMPAGLNSRWIIDFEKQIFRGKHVLLYGNVHDQFLWRGSYLTAADFITQYFQEKQFELIVRYDPIDGFNFATPEMRREFRGIVRRRILESNPGVSGGETPDPSDAADTPPENNDADDSTATGGAADDPTKPPSRRKPGQQRPGRRRVEQRADPATAFAQMRMALSQGEKSVITIVNLGDMLTSDPSRYSETERNIVILLKRRCSAPTSSSRDHWPATAIRW